MCVRNVLDAAAAVSSSEMINQAAPLREIHLFWVVDCLRTMNVLFRLGQNLNTQRQINVNKDFNFQNLTGERPQPCAERCKLRARSNQLAEWMYFRPHRHFKCISEPTAKKSDIFKNNFTCHTLLSRCLTYRVRQVRPFN